MARNYNNKYKRKYKKQKRNMKNNYYRKASNDELAANMGVAGYRLAKKALSFLNVEFKDLTNVYTPTVTASGSITTLNGVQEGDGASRRDGRQIEFKGINLHCRLKANATTPMSATVRTILFKWKGPDGRLPTISDLLENSAAPNYQAFYNLENVPQDFQILSDKTLTLNHESEWLKSFDIRYNDHDIKTRYQGNSSSYLDISTNGIYLAVIGSAYDGVNFPSLDIVSRLRYIDN